MYCHSFDLDTEQEHFYYPELTGHHFYNWLMYRGPSERPAKARLVAEHRRRDRSLFRLCVSARACESRALLRKRRGKLTERPGDFQVDETQSDQIRETATFLRQSFPHTQQMTDDYLRWFYLDNPDGRTLSANCIRNSKLVGHIALTPLVANVYGNAERGVLVTSVATDPDLGRRGLFTDLLTVGLDAAAERGFKFAIAVPNSQSFGAFVKRTGFTSLGPLEARIGISRPPPPTRPVEFAFERQWSPEALRWRLSNPEALYQREQRGDRLVIDADSGTLGVRVELASFDRMHENVEEEWSSREQSNRRNPSLCSRLPIHLYVGIDARRTWRLHAETNIPMRMRPAPLNLVIRDLTTQARKWMRDSTHSRALDFDAF